MLTTILDATLTVIKSLSLRVVLLVILTNLLIGVITYQYFKSDIEKIKIAGNLDKAQSILEIKKDIANSNTLLQEIKKENAVLEAQVKLLIDLINRK